MKRGRDHENHRCRHRLFRHHNHRHRYSRTPRPRVACGNRSLPCHSPFWNLAHGRPGWSDCRRYAPPRSLGTTTTRYFTATPRQPDNPSPKARVDRPLPYHKRGSTKRHLPSPRITPSGFHRDWLSSPRLSVRIARPRNLLTNRSTSPLPRRCRSLPTIRIFVTGQAFQHQCQCIDNTPMAIIGSMHAAHSSARRFEATLRFDP